MSCGFVQEFVCVSMVNPQRSTPYFSVQLSVYDGDTFSTVVDRVRRTSGVPGEWVWAGGLSIHLSVRFMLCVCHRDCSLQMSSLEFKWHIKFFALFNISWMRKWSSSMYNNYNALCLRSYIYYIICSEVFLGREWGCEWWEVEGWKEGPIIT